VTPRIPPSDAVRKQLWLGHLPLAQRVVGEFCHNKFFYEDAVQEVQLALWEASEQWDESMQDTFNHYAWLVMRRKLLYYLTVKASDRPRLSRREQSVMNAIRQTLSTGQLISCSTLELISKESGISRFRLTQLVNFWYSSRVAITATGFIQLDELIDPEVYQENVKAIQVLEECLKLLPEREQMIIRERFLKDPRSTLGALSDVLKVSIERVRQIEAHSIIKLRQMLTDRLGED
jgi:RNA polymerase sigma factor (sigma-70 family)